MTALSIGLFTYSTKPRGSVVHAAALAEALDACGHQVTLYALDKDGAGFFRPLSVPYVGVPARPAEAGSEALIAQRIAELSGFLAARRPRHDVVHAEDCLVASGLCAARAALGGALLCRTVHHVEAFESAYLESCQARSIHEAELLLCVSEKTRAEVRHRYGRDASVVPNGVDLARFGAPCARSDALALRARLGVPASAKLMLSVGGVEPRKNSLAMLRGFVRAHALRPELHWLIAGGASIFEHAEYRAAFARELAALPIEVRRAITQVGVLDDALMPALYASADLLLHAALQEGFGLCVLEAMAAGRPVVVSRGAPFDEYLDDDCALRVDPHVPTSIADGVLAALSAQAARVRAAWTRAAAFSWTQSALRHAQLYRATLETGRGLSTCPRSELHA